MNSFSAESQTNPIPEAEEPILPSKIIMRLKKMGPKQLRQALSLLNVFGVEGLKPEEIVDVRNVIQKIFLQKITKKFKKMEVGELRQTLETVNGLETKGLSRGEIEDVRSAIQRIIVLKEGNVTELGDKKRPKTRRKTGFRKANVIPIVKTPKSPPTPKLKTEPKKESEHPYLYLVKSSHGHHQNQQQRRD